MSLTGNYADRAKGNYKTVEGKKLLASVRGFLRLLDTVMKEPSSYKRGQEIGRLASSLEMAADLYDLFGEKDRRRNKVRDPRT